MAYSAWDVGTNVGTNAGYGAAIGTAVAPGIGTAIGGGIGALTGVFQSIAGYDNDKERRRAVRELSKQINADYDQLQNMFNDFYAKNASLFGKDADQNYAKASEAINDFDFSKYDWLDTDGDGKLSDSEKEAARYTYNKDIDYFMNPYLDELQADAANKVEHTAAGAGLGRGTGAARAVANSVADIKDKAYNTALNEWKADRDFDYKAWSDYTTSMQDRLKNMMTADQWQIGQQKGLGEDFINWQTSQLENNAKLAQGRSDALTQIGIAGL